MRIRDLMRYPRTIAELRAGATRAKRRHLPTAWDDKPRCIQRTWKVHRKTRYRWRS